MNKTLLFIDNTLLFGDECKCAYSQCMQIETVHFH
jgi:hypothetical protein